jgi:hypothetical protein
MLTKVDLRLSQAAMKVDWSKLNESCTWLVHARTSETTKKTRNKKHIFCAKAKCEKKIVATLLSRLERNQDDRKKKHSLRILTQRQAVDGRTWKVRPIVHDALPPKKYRKTTNGRET